MEEKRRDSAGTPPTPAVENLASAMDQSTSSRRRGGGQKRKSTSINSGGGSSAPQTASSKRQAREKPPVVPFPPIHINGPCTRARVHPNNSNNFSKAAVSVKVESEAREGTAKAEEMRGLSEDWEALEAKIETEYESVISRDANVHVVPLHAGWFSWTKIHSLEEKMLPSFFNGKSESRSPEIYMEIRNWIMKKFHLNPNTQIELKQLSELTVGDFDARQEVMEFLDYWGLINYHPFPQKEPAAMIADADEAGEKDSLVERLFQFETVQSWTPVITWTNAEIPAMTSGLLPESVISEELVKSEGVEYHCNSCSADCSRKRYHCQKQADFDLCAECFNDGKFGSDMSPSDFILMEPAEAGGVSGGNWTDQETLLLLEAIELFRDNWSEIAEHVATKTKAQCILHFVQMPIEDAFFNCEDEKNEDPKENGLPVTIATENSSPKADCNRDPALKDVPEKTESQGVVADNQDSSCPMEISNLEEVSDSDKSLEVGENLALTALKEAFDAVGSLSSPGERLSFAGACNPVMAVAAFLVRLVEPNIATASVHSFLKALSRNHSGEQLSARHCFRLEDPPDDKKNQADSEGAEIETIECEAPKDENEHVEKQTQETPDSGIDGISVHDDNDENKDSVSEEHKGKKDTASEQKLVASTSSECASRSDALKEPDGVVTCEEVQPASVSEPGESDFPKKQAPKDAEESVILASHAELHSNSVKESEDGASAGEPFQYKEALKDEDLMSKSEKNETERLAVPKSMAEKEEITGDGEAKECGSEKKDPLVTKNELDSDKLKRAAVTALSAAAVKAKLLADQEEDQIRQLAILLIEKQLHKLETKLAFFSDLEIVVMRVKEQLDRSKQRLFHERAQIIATRLGMSASARPTSQLLPPNRAAATFPNPASRPLMGMNSFRPPISRPLMVSNPASSIPIPTNAAGSSMQPNADKLSSVGTK